MRADCAQCVFVAMARAAFSSSVTRRLSSDAPLPLLGSGGALWMSIYPVAALPVCLFST